MSSLDFFRNLQPLFESKDVDMEEKVTKAEDKRKADKEDAAVKALDKDKKASNVKETAGAFFRRYSDIIKEAEEMSEGQNDGKYQKGSKVNYQGATGTVSGLTKNQDGEEMAFIQWDDQTRKPKLNPAWGPDTVPTHWLNPAQQQGQNFPKGVDSGFTQ